MLLIFHHANQVQMFILVDFRHEIINNSIIFNTKIFSIVLDCKEIQWKILVNMNELQCKITFKSISLLTQYLEYEKHLAYRSSRWLNNKSLTSCMKSMINTIRSCMVRLVSF